MLGWHRLQRVRNPNGGICSCCRLPAWLFTWKHGALNGAPLITLSQPLWRFCQQFLSGRFVHTKATFAAFSDCGFISAASFYLTLLLPGFHLMIDVILVKCLFLLRFDLHPFYRNTHRPGHTLCVFPPTVPLGGVEFPPALQTCPVATMPLAASARKHDSSAALLTGGVRTSVMG